MRRRWDSFADREHNQTGYNVHLPNINYILNDNELNAKTVLDYQTPKYSHGNKLRLLKDITTRNGGMSKSPSNSSKS